jgi:putative methionine-R-sulfoxide reductase with GAF domain
MQFSATNEQVNEAVEMRESRSRHGDMSCSARVIAQCSVPLLTPDNVLDIECGHAEQLDVFIGS